MVAGKVIVFLAIVAVAAIFTEANSVPQVGLYANNSNKSHDLVIGYRQPGDRLVVRSRVVKNSSWMKIVTEQKTFNASRWDRITMVQALDQKTNGNGAYASILNGGPGHQNVTIRFKSQRSHGIDFIVELYARPWADITGANKAVWMHFLNATRKSKFIRLCKTNVLRFWIIYSFGFELVNNLCYQMKHNK